MTRWVEDPVGGRNRGPVAILRAWVGVLIAPRQFFRGAVAPGDQAPGLVFGGAVVLVEETTRYALIEGARPVFAGRPLASAALAVGVAVVLVTPAVLHLVAAIETVLLAGLTNVIGFAPDRGGVGETVQVVAYAAAPCALAGAPIPLLRAVCAGYAAVLLIVGLAIVHRMSYPKAVIAAVLPAALVFGYGFRGFAALVTLWG